MARTRIFSIGSQDTKSKEAAQARNCIRCQRPLAPGAAHLIDGDYRCRRCTLRYWGLLRRSAQTALVVGSLLTVINHGVNLLQGHASAALLWQVPLTYCVPFCVATWGALINTRR